MDASLTQDNCDIGNDTSSIKTTTETNYESSCQGACNEHLKQKDNIVNEKEQFRNVEEGAAICDNGGVELLRKSPGGSIKNPSLEHLEQSTEDATTKCPLRPLELLPHDATVESSSPMQAILEQDRACTEQKQEFCSGTVQNMVGAGETSVLEQSNVQSEYLTIKSPSEQLVALPAEATIDSSSEQLGSLPDGSSGNPCPENPGPSPEDEAMNPRRLGRGGKRTSARNSVKSSVESTRVLRSRSQEKPKAAELSNASVSHPTTEEKKRKKRKENDIKAPANEFSKIRRHLKYLIHRMNYEQNLIDAYAGEGWKGQSLEKVKLEKEIERARNEMLLRKLKIRELFQRLDLSCSEGRLPESLFDAEGEIDSDDIFCAKCGLKDLSLDNDIILCDGACERGFHQFCLQPPLLKEDIPPDDEGWLCPGCDCKVDCTNILNETQGTNLSITDSWEKVYPEAAATGNKLDDNLGLSSDDSEDDDYNPDGLEVDEKAEGDEQNSDESDFYSASDGLGGSPKNDQNLGLPSDDSEDDDDDYDPDAKEDIDDDVKPENYVGLPSDDSEDDDDYNPDANDSDDHVKQENSSSDFSSDSEDFDAAVEEKNLSGDDEDSNRKISRPSETKLQPMNAELSSLLESESAQTDSTSLSGKRRVERLDYKKLHDETYGNVPTDSSDDEEWVDTAGPKKRRSNDGKAVLVSPNGDTENGEETSHVTPKRRVRKKPSNEGRNDSPDVPQQGSAEPGSSRKSATKSTSKKLGEAVKQMLFKSFQENQYPDRAMKEKLANELVITVQQVSKWFENARWSFRHTSRMDSYTTTESTPPNNEPKPNTSCGNDDTTGLAAPSSGVEEAQNPVTATSTGQKSGTPRYSKKKGKVDNQDLECSPNIETSEARKSGRGRRKTVA